MAIPCRVSARASGNPMPGSVAKVRCHAWDGHLAAHPAFESTKEYVQARVLEERCMIIEDKLSLEVGGSHRACEHAQILLATPQGVGESLEHLWTGRLS